jgi:class 3 adenylate cyclase
VVTFGVFAKRLWSEDYPWAPTPEERQRYIEDVERMWGSEADLAMLASSAENDPAFARWLSSYLRQGASPRAAAALARMNTFIDVRDVLPTIRVPTLVMHRTEDAEVSVEEGRYIASQIPDARFVELAGADHFMFLEDADVVLDEIEEFLTGVRRGPEPDRVLATVLFTDIVGSTERAAELGDRNWSELLGRHHAQVRGNLEAHRGQEVDTAGDGFLATFDGPARAVRCALASVRDLRQLGLPIRAGIHTGEVETAGQAVRGIAVHIGARIASLAAPGEVLVSRTVKDLVAGSGLEFSGRGEHELKGVPDRWELFAAR